MIMEAKKSHYLPPAKCRTKKVSGAIQSESAGLRTRCDGVSSSPEA